MSAAETPGGAEEAAWHAMLRRAAAALESLRAACREPQAAYGLLPVMYGRPLRGYHRFLALGETVAHLNYLWHAGDLKRTVDDAGRIHFLAG